MDEIFASVAANMTSLQTNVKAILLGGVLLAFMMVGYKWFKKGLNRA